MRSFLSLKHWNFSELQVFYPFATCIFSQDEALAHMTAGPLLRHQILDVPSISWLSKNSSPSGAKVAITPRIQMKPIWSNDSCMSHQTGPPKQQLLLQHILLLLQIGRPMLLQCKSEMLDATCCYLQKPLRQTTILLLRQGFAMSCMKKLRKMGLEASTWVVQVLSKNIFSTPHFPSSDPKIKMIQPIYVTSIEISTFLSDPFNSCRSDLGHPAGPPIRGFCCSMVDGLKVWRTKKQIEKKDDTKNLLVKVGWCTYCHLISC